MSNLLLEIGCEELPASYIQPALKFIKNEIIKNLNFEKLNYKSVIVEGTQRRLILIIYKLDITQVNTDYEVNGPQKEIAYKKSGKLSEIGFFFLKSKKINEEKLYIKKIKNREIIAAKITKKGQETKNLLPKIIEKILSNIPFPKKMYWEENKILFARPVRWILSIFNNEILNIKFADLKSDNKTFGHKLLNLKEKKIKSISQYLNYLKKNNIIISYEERKKNILEKSCKLAEKIKGKIYNDKNLIESLSNMMETPYPIISKFNEKYLQIPMEILITEMIENQKYFPIIDSENNLSNYFIMISGTKQKTDKKISKYNGKILESRFEDALFYYNQDLECKLKIFSKNTKKMIFQKKLGTIGDKINRIKETTNFIFNQLNLEKNVYKNIEKIIPICKSDLSSNIVSRFPRLQGVIGKIYALKENKKNEIANPIEQHYWPKYSEDKLPESNEASIIGISDRVDTLIGIIGIGKITKGTYDPFSLRRISIAICKIIIEKKYSLSIKDLLNNSINSFDKKCFTLEKQQIKEKAFDFINNRAKNLFLSMTDKYKTNNNIEIINAIMHMKSDNLFEIWSRIKAVILLASKKQDNFYDLCLTMKRIRNILNQAHLKYDFKVNDNFIILNKTTEVRLLRKLNHINFIIKGDNKFYYDNLLSGILNLKSDIDDFFNDTIVMSENKQLRESRLSLISKIENLSFIIADFSKIKIK